MSYVFIAVVSYLIGSIPTAYIFGKVAKGIDIREHGSGNVGATNVFRVLGKKPGIVCLILDILKGVLAVVFVPDLFGFTEGYFPYILASFAVVCGHNWTIFLKFKGGKGIATTLGVLIGLTIQIVSIRVVLVWTLLSWIVCFLISGFVSLSSIVAAIALPFIMFFTKQPLEILFLGVVFSIFVVVRHKANIQRLLKKEEPVVHFPFKRGSCK